MSLAECVKQYEDLLKRGATVEAMQRFYAEDVCVFENRSLARAGREQCITYEREQLARQPRPPEFRVRRSAVNEAEGVAFLEYVVRFTSSDGRPMRLEQVSVQRWHGALISEERFYYDGVVDEGD
jgi:ketosteroid isomerase-like protein